MNMGKKQEKTAGVIGNPVLDKAASNLFLDLVRALDINRRHVVSITVYQGTFTYQYNEAYANAVGAYGGQGSWDATTESDKVREAVRLFAYAIGLNPDDLVSVYHREHPETGQSELFWRRMATPLDPAFVKGNKVDHRETYRFVGETASR